MKHRKNIIRSRYGCLSAFLIIGRVMWQMCIAEIIFFDKFYSINHWKRCGFFHNFINGSFFKRKSKLRQPSCLLNPDKRTGAMARNNYIFFERGCFCAIIARLLIHFMSFPFWFFHPFSSHHFFQQKKIMAKNVNNSN